MSDEDARYSRVVPTPEEREAWASKYPRRAAPYRVECARCGQRLWLSGLGWGAHLRSAKHAAASRTQPYA